MKIDIDTKPTIHEYQNLYVQNDDQYARSPEEKAIMDKKKHDKFNFQKQLFPKFLNISEDHLAKCWLCLEEITENKKYTLTCGHDIHRQCARNLDHYNGYIDLLKCNVCGTENIGVEELYAGKNGCQIHVIIIHENTPTDFITIKYEMEMKFRDIKQMIYWKERIGSDRNPKKLLFQTPHDFFYCVKKMNDNSMVESKTFKEGSILRLEPTKKTIFHYFLKSSTEINMGISEIFHVYRDGDASSHPSMGLSMTMLKTLGPFTITPYSNKQIRIHLDVGKNGIFKVSLLWDKQNNVVDILHDYKTVRERIKNHSVLNCLYILWIEKTNTNSCELYTFRNIYHKMYPPENKIDLKQLKIEDFLLSQQFENTKSFMFYSDSRLPSVFQNFNSLSDSMNHEMKAFVLKEKFIDFFVIIVFTGLVLTLILKTF